MEIYSLALYLTDDCNFDCDYCYQKRGDHYLDISTLKKTVDFFFPFLKKECYINFYGGEPLLSFTHIQHITDYIHEKNKTKKSRFVFSITTNGSLIDEKKLEFMDHHSFSLLISFDGMAQDISRKNGSLDKIARVLKKGLQYPHIDLETNSVFTPSTIGYLSKSFQLIAEMGVPNINIALSQTSSWDYSSLAQLKVELHRLKEFLIPFHRRWGYVPCVNFRKDHRKGVFACYAAKDRMAVTAEGKLWGCHLFADFFKGKEHSDEYSKFCFGDLDSFVKNFKEIYPKISANYRNLRMDQFHTGNTNCIDCDELEECKVCPMGNRIHTPSLHEIPGWVCEKNKIVRKAKKQFWNECRKVPAAAP